MGLLPHIQAQTFCCFNPCQCQLRLFIMLGTIEVQPHQETREARATELTAPACRWVAPDLVLSVTWRQEKRKAIYQVAPHDVGRTFLRSQPSEADSEALLRCFALSRRRSSHPRPWPSRPMSLTATLGRDRLFVLSILPLRSTASFTLLLPLSNLCIVVTINISEHSL